MDKTHVKTAIEELKKSSKRNFVQSYDLIINLKNIVTKTNPVDLFIVLPYTKGTKAKIAAFVDQQLSAQAEKFCDAIIKETDFIKYSDKKLLRKLAEQYDYFIAQANLMPKVAATFGKVLGTRGKMPNPKLGCVVPPNANLEVLSKRLSTTVHVATKKGTNLQCTVGKQDQSDEEVAENILSVYHHVLKQVPNETQNIKNVLIKFSMSNPIKI